ncbi:hypothetical protein QBC40DRAFT_277142 [Triangularia verruculosa]|uniref:Uncharacterized protein n=1 Tax=Triangularia verruculosa TaxID=2587418 RepID=A0AAN6XQU8_9PEZI|nr:hypothetical protein QBC40DRAFT_277142 [Triangularia verruculosa]
MWCLGLTSLCLRTPPVQTSLHHYLFILRPRHPSRQITNVFQAETPQSAVDMRTAVFFLAALIALAAAAPEMTMEKLQERALCTCNENRCRGPACCANGTC